MTTDAHLRRLLDVARRADDPARRVVEALVDDPLFASWAAAEAGAELETPTTAWPGRGELVVHASGIHRARMEAALDILLGPRPRRRGAARPGDRLLVLLSPQGELSVAARGGAAGGRLPTGVGPGACLALVLGSMTAEVEAGLAELGATVRRLGEARTLLAEVQREARASGLTPVVLHRHLRGDAGDAGRGLARAARAVAGGMAGVPRPACLIVVGELRPAPGGSDPAEAVVSAARHALRYAGSGVEVGAVAVGADRLRRVLGVALVR